MRDSHWCEEEGRWPGSSLATGIVAGGPRLLGGGMGPKVRVVEEAGRWRHGVGRWGPVVRQARGPVAGCRGPVVGRWGPVVGRCVSQ
jgi:hypothetical protein